MQAGRRYGDRKDVVPEEIADPERGQRQVLVQVPSLGFRSDVLAPG